MDSLVPKQRMWNFGAIWGVIFLSFSTGNKLTQTTARVLSLFQGTLSGFRGKKTSRSAVLCQHSCFTTHGKKRLLKATKTVVSMSRNEDKLNRPVSTFEICFELSHDQALTHSCLLLRFLSTGGTTAKPLCFFVFFCMWDYFSTAAHTRLGMGQGLQLCLMFWFFSEQSLVIRSRERAPGPNRETV